MSDQANTAPVNPMSPEVLEALHGSIAKWEEIVSGVRLDQGHRDCPLCRLFFRKDCEGCPVAARTGSPACDDTPYRIFKDNGERKADAKAELAFLKSLLPGAAS